jgi:hypothetical protein
MIGPSHSQHHTALATAVEALEAKVGVDSSAVTSSHDYKIRQLEAALAALQPSIVTKTSDYSAIASDGIILVNASGGAVTVTLPPAASCAAGKRICVKKIDPSDNFVTADGSGSEPIDDASQKIVPVQNQFLWFVTDQVQWYVV